MSTLLIPIDFSENATVAANYGAQLALQHGCNITLFHAFTSHVNQYANASHIVDPTEVEDRTQMDTFLETIQKAYPTVNFSVIFSNGVLSDALDKEELRHSYQAVIMGTKGSSGLESVLIGSNTYDVIKDSKIPILAIPKNAVTAKTDNIALLTNFKPGELEVLKQAIPLFGNKFHLLLVHIDRGSTDIKVIGQKLKAWIEQIATETGIDDISYIIKPQNYFAGSRENIADGIHSILREEDIDVILITKSRKSFFQSVFTENIVKKMAFEISVPNFFGRTS